MFGYNNLVTDIRSLPILKLTGYPVIFDASHSVQLPGGKGVHSSGQSQFIDILSKACVTVGIAGLFIETHEKPKNAVTPRRALININGKSAWDMALNLCLGCALVSVGVLVA